MMNNRREWSHLGPVIPLFSTVWHLNMSVSRTDLLDPFLTVLGKGMKIFTLCCGSLLAPKIHHYNLYLVLIPELSSMLLPPSLYWIEEDERRRQWLLVVFVGYVFPDCFSPCGPRWPAFKNTLLSPLERRRSTRQLSLYMSEY